ncbi:UDP-3-O-acyl-N-acetylglucosamine deacetylase [Peptococcaceae bacterium 1198_IL3148]
MMQTTINRSVCCQGIDITGKAIVNMQLAPAEINSGIVFVRNDLPGNPQVRCNANNCLVESRWTSLQENGVRVDHTEHILATIAGLGIDNIIIRLDNPSIPVVDGYSCKDFTEKILSAGIKELSAPKKYFQVKSPCLIVDQFYSGGQRYEKFIAALPADNLELIYILEYPDGSLPGQMAQYSIVPEVFINQLADARSYITAGEYQQVAKLIGKGMDSVLVFSPGKLVGLRWPNEPARHKLVDLLGDLSTVGCPLKGKFIAFRSGHQLNNQLIKKITKNWEEGNR